MTLALITGINVGLAIANVTITLFNLRLFRAQDLYLKRQTEFYDRQAESFALDDAARRDVLKIYREGRSEYRH